jgi:hypothetical protein
LTVRYLRDELQQNEREATASLNQLLTKEFQSILNPNETDNLAAAKKDAPHDEDDFAKRLQSLLTKLNVDAEPDLFERKQT